MTGNEIRQQYIEYFTNTHGHAPVASSSLLPADDPTLLFTNAGMNQFKPLFLGTETRDYTRAVNSQKCIRAGGKHNDLEDVGRDCYHHTFFEMLGNWSFGDYFKADAIAWAWDLLTGVWGLDPTRIHATYFEGDASDGLEPDTESRDLWKNYLPDDHIHTGNKKDNFWEMGETGPCGPCTEIHYDATPQGDGGPLVNQDDALVIEIWNLVFIQFNRLSDHSLEPLPSKHVDTGMGLERVVKVIQGKKSNYATDLFVPLLEKVETMTPHRYGPSAGEGEDRFDTMDETEVGDVAMRVIADHVRTATFAITDGILPSNDGRGSVLRSIIRRAAGFGREHLKIQGPFLYQFVDVVVSMFAGAFPELTGRADYVRGVILDEEDSFGKTLDRGLQLLSREIALLRGTGKETISGEVCFELHATYGFPFTLTKLMAEKAGLAVDESRFQAEMDAHRKASQGGGSKFKSEAIVGLPATDDSPKYFSHTEVIEATVLGWVADGKFVDQGELSAGDEGAVVLDRTNFYGEQGGQLGDRGEIMDNKGVFDVVDTKVAGQCVLHVGKIRSGVFAVGDTVRCMLCPSRMDTMRNHSATHLLNFALREVLGDEVHQQGSEVSSERLRFDFTHPKAVTAEQLAKVEVIANAMILSHEPIEAKLVPLAEAQQIPGVRAMFGEKYPDPVRVITMGDSGHTAVEFCGGTHLKNTGLIGLLKIVGEESVAKGVRRISAITGPAALQWVADADAVLKGLSTTLKTSTDGIAERVTAMQAEIKKLKKRPAVAAGGSTASTEVSELATRFGKVLIAKGAVCDAGAMRTFCDQERQKGAAAIFIGATDGEKVMLVAMVDDAVAKSGALKAGDWVKAIAPIVGGGGGGKPTMAQAGGKIPAKLDEALQQAKAFIDA